MKKHVKHESLLNTVARSVGRAAGTIAKATQEFAGDAAAMVKTIKAETVKGDTTDRPKVRRAPARTPRSRTPKQKPKLAKSVTRRSRARA